MAINITNISNIGSMGQLGSYASAQTGGLFWSLILFSFFVIIAIRLREYEIDALITACLICVFLGAMLLYASWIPVLTEVLFGLGFVILLGVRMMRS